MNAATALEVAVETHPFFEGMQARHIEILKSCAANTRFHANQLIFREDEPATAFYLVETGRIALEVHRPADGDSLIEYIGPGEVLGWSWLFPPFLWHFRAQALEDTEVIVLNAAHLLVAAEEDHEFGYELMKRVAQILIHRLQATRQRLVGRVNSEECTI